MQPATTYPRPSGVLVPSDLLRAGCPRPEVTLDRMAAAGEVVAWVRGAMRKLPPRLLDTELPEPQVVLKTWVIGQRTRGALERMLSVPTARPIRRLRDYQLASRIGPHVLVDLLAAREEARLRAAASAAVTNPTTRVPSRRTRAEAPAKVTATFDLVGRSDEVSAAIRDLLPLQPDQLGQALTASGHATTPPSFDEIVRIYKERQVPVPFRLVRRGGATVLVAPESISSAEALVTNAAHFVFHWGVCTLSTLVGRMRAMATLPFGVKDAARILTTIPRFRWLDEASGWFSFAGSGSRLGATIRKVFAVVDRVRLTDLAAALSKQVELLSTIPVRAIEAYLRDVVGCEIVDGWVQPRAPLGSASFGAGERTVVEVLRQHGGELATTSVRQLASGAGLTASTLRNLVRTSPLVLETVGQLRLVGVPRAAALA